MKKSILLTVMAVFMIAPVWAQDRNNEDEVVKLDPQFSRFNSVPHQLIMKFNDYSDIKLGTKDGQWFVSTSKDLTINSVLAEYNIENIEQLCPNFKMPARPRVTPSYGGKDVVEKDLSQMYLITLRPESAKNNHELIDALKELDEVEFAEPNYIVSALGSEGEMVPADNGTKDAPQGVSVNDPFFSQQWGLPATQLPQLWAVDTTYAADGSDRPIIAIVDTGVDVDHPDLADNIWTNPGESATANGYDNDNNGFKDDLHGYDFVNKTGDMHDFNSHGTHCAGIAAAVGDNGIGVCGANPNALIMPVAVLQSNGSGDVATIVQGINYAAQNGADFISMSFGTYAYSIALEQALGQAYQTAFLVGSAGNDELAIDPRCSDPTAKPVYPGAFTFVLGVQATTNNNSLAGFSNWDCDGPSFSQFSEEQLYNYEVSAPGAGIVSTVPGGQYRSYNGTSMACPLVAGGLSALMHAKNYPTKEMVFGDMINTTQEFHNVKFFDCYDAGPAPAQLQFVAYELQDTISGMGDGDLRPDAGEMIAFYPTIRTTWGAADSINYWLEFDEFEDTNTVHFISGTAQFGRPLSAYAKSKAAEPFLMQINPDVVDGRYINLVLKAACPNAQYVLEHPFSIQVENGVELKGVITGDMTLFPNVHYIVTENLAVPEGVTLTIEPGTVIKIKDRVSIYSSGTIKAIGEPGNMITFTKTDLGNGWERIHGNSNDILNYCVIEYSIRHNESGDEYGPVPGCGNVTNCVIRYCNSYYPITPYDVVFNRCNLFYLTARICFRHNSLLDIPFSNFVNNQVSHSSYKPYLVVGGSDIQQNPVCNIFNTISQYGLGDYYIGNESQTVSIVPINNGVYLGSAKESIVRPHVYDIYAPGSSSGTYIDLTNMATRPSAECHGIVWKVEVNGHDAQDEFDSIAPLGMGHHRFDVYFNRPMDVSVTPMLAMGVRPPYTQNAINENGSWSTDSLVYTAYLNVKSVGFTDGLNRIYVANARDNEHFEIPIENLRFNVQVATAGSLSAGFMATPGIGKVGLEWNNNDVDYDDYLGYNIYRYTYDSVPDVNGRWEWGYNENGGWGYIPIDTIWGSTDTIMLNTSLVQDTLFTDYDVEPGKRYYYFYRVLRTNLSEGEPSRTVSTVPLSTLPGDANGSCSVDVADIVATINYICHNDPHPFLFEAADINKDGVVNVLDIVGIINIILHPEAKSSNEEPVQHMAEYTIEDGILYMNSPVEIAGVQVMLNMEGFDLVEKLSALNGFEIVSGQVDSQYMVMAYSMIGRTIAPGKQALLRIGDSNLDEIVATDAHGNNILMQPGNVTAIYSSEATRLQLGTPFPNPFNNSITIPYMVNAQQSGIITFVITDVMGRMIDRIEVGPQSFGAQTLVWTPKQNLPQGMYFVGMYHNGTRVQQTKLVKN